MEDAEVEVLFTALDELAEALALDPETDSLIDDVAFAEIETLGLAAALDESEIEAEADGEPDEMLEEEYEASVRDSD